MLNAAECCRPCQGLDCPRNSGIESTAEHIDERIAEIITSRERVKIGKTIELRENCWRVSDSLIGVICAREITVLKGAARSALAVSTAIVENGSSSIHLSNGTKRLTKTLAQKSSWEKTLPKPETKTFLKKLLLIVFGLNKTCENKKQKAVKKAMDCAEG